MVIPHSEATSDVDARRITSVAHVEYILLHWTKHHIQSINHHQCIKVYVIWSMLIAIDGFARSMSAGVGHFPLLVFSSCQMLHLCARQQRLGSRYYHTGS